MPEAGKPLAGERGRIAADLPGIGRIAIPIPEGSKPLFVRAGNRHAQLRRISGVSHRHEIHSLLLPTLLARHPCR